MPATAELACKLSGSNLFLIDSVSGEAQFSHSVQVPEGFLGSALPVPHPAAGPLYVRLRDDPGVVNPATLVATQLAASPEDLAKSAARRPAPSSDASVDADSASRTDSHEAPPTPAPSRAAAVTAAALRVLVQGSSTANSSDRARRGWPTRNKNCCLRMRQLVALRVTWWPLNPPLEEGPPLALGCNSVATALEPPAPTRASSDAPLAAAYRWSIERLEEIGTISPERPEGSGKPRNSRRTSSPKKSARHSP